MLLVKLLVLTAVVLPWLVSASSRTTGGIGGGAASRSRLVRREQGGAVPPDKDKQDAIDQFWRDCLKTAMNEERQTWRDAERLCTNKVFREYNHRPRAGVRQEWIDTWIAREQQLKDGPRDSDFQEGAVGYDEAVGQGERRRRRQGTIMPFSFAWLSTPKSPADAWRSLRGPDVLSSLKAAFPWSDEKGEEEQNQRRGAPSQGNLRFFRGGAGAGAGAGAGGRIPRTIRIGP